MSISKKLLEEMKAMRDKDIDTSDIPELDDRFWENAKLVMPQPKPSISLRIEPEVLDWFKSFGRGYQTRMNAVLRSYMEAHREKHS